MILKFIPKRIATFRLCPSTKVCINKYFNIELEHKIIYRIPLPKTVSFFAALECAIQQ